MIERANSADAIVANAQPKVRILDSTRVEMAHAETNRIAAIPDHVLEIAPVAVVLDPGTVATVSNAVRPEVVRRPAEIVICHWNLYNRIPRICRAAKYGTELS